MHPLSRNIAERADDHALALQPAFAGESAALDHDSKMRFSASVVACVSVMLRAVIDHLEVIRRESLGQYRFDLICDCFEHD